MREARSSWFHFAGIVTVETIIRIFVACISAGRNNCEVKPVGTRFLEYRGEIPEILGDSAGKTLPVILIVENSPIRVTGCICFCKGSETTAEIAKLMFVRVERALHGQYKRKDNPRIWMAKAREYKRDVSFIPRAKINPRVKEISDDGRRPNNRGRGRDDFFLRAICQLILYKVLPSQTLLGYFAAEEDITEQELLGITYSIYDTRVGVKRRR